MGVGPGVFFDFRGLGFNLLFEQGFQNYRTGPGIFAAFDLFYRVGQAGTGNNDRINIASRCPP